MLAFEPSSRSHSLLSSRLRWQLLLVGVVVFVFQGWFSAQAVAKPQDGAASESKQDVSSVVEPDRTAQDEEKQSEEGEEDSGDEAKQSKADDFLRVRKDDDGEPVALETSITRYTGKNARGEEVIVDLIGVVHIGEGEYYKELNKRFEDYDALLYELVAPEGTRIPADGVREGGFNPISGMQTMMQDMLDLEFQLEQIDYNRGNFIHADMSPEEFSESMVNNDESFAKMFFKMIGHSMARSSSQASGGSDLALLMAYFSDDRAIKLRKIMAEQMRDMDMALTMFEGKEGSTIITHRNKKALEVMQREINNGKKRLGIFYGAGHLPDMEERLLGEFNMTRGEKSWLVAWKLTK